MTENTHQKMYRACADAITLATQLGAAPDLPHPDVLRQRINATLEALRSKVQQADLPTADAMEAIYAIAAFMDEQILRSPWPARQQWMAQPLQLVLFQENTAGEGFFDRLAALEAEADRGHVVQIYFLCIALGFQGKFAVNPGALASIQERAASQLSRKLPATEIFSPSAYPKVQVNFNVRQFPVVGVALGLSILSVLVYVILVITTGISADNAAERIRTTASSETAGAK